MFEARVYFKSGNAVNVKMRKQKDQISVMTLSADGNHEHKYKSYLTDEVEDGLPVYRPQDDD